MPKLNQVIAIEKGIKSRAHAALSELHETAKKKEDYYGFARTYRPKDDAGENFPRETKKVTNRAQDILATAVQILSPLVDVTAQKDFANQSARALVVVGDTVSVFTLITDAPVSYLLFLEKLLSDLRALVSAIPVLDESDQWQLAENRGMWATHPVETHRARKVQKPIVLFPATPEHPAQTQLITEDEVVGYWSTEKQSGAYDRVSKYEMLARIEQVSNAIKAARESANETEALHVFVASGLFDYLFGQDSPSA